MREVTADEWFQIRVFEENRPPRQMNVKATTTVAEVLAKCKITKLNQIDCYFGAEGLTRPCTFAGLQDTFARADLATSPTLGFRYWLDVSVPSLWVGYMPREGNTKSSYNWLLTREAYEEWKGIKKKEAKAAQPPVKRDTKLLRRKKRYSPEAVLSKLGSGKLDFDGDLVNTDSQRLMMFKVKGMTCVKCGLTGKHFIKERAKQHNSYHFNLYAIDAEGDEVLMTKDHIVPRKLGGADVMTNYQPMCCICNHAKGSKEEE